MVGAIKRWLGIDLIQAEILTLQGSNAALSEEILILSDRIKRSDQCLTEALEVQKQLTSEPAKPKIVPKQRVNWKQFRSAAEKSSDPEREEA